METTIGMWLALVVGVLPLLLWLLQQWNEIWYVWRLKAAGANLPPGHMGIPYFGELLTFLWYFKVVCRPDEFINSKRRKYGDNVGLYRTYLFGSPAIIACSPSVNKYVFQSDDKFLMEWPSIEIMGKQSVIALHGNAHARLRSYLIHAINQPDALRRVALIVQPRIITALQSWTEKGKIIARNETKKVTLENIVMMFASLEQGPLLDTMDQLFAGIMRGVRANPINFPGTAFYHALQCRKKLVAIFKAELEKKRNQKVSTTSDLMDGLMQITNEEGIKLSDAEVLDNIISFVAAGYESTALSSMWALYYLAKYPDVLKKLREENMAISQNKKGEYITSEDVSKMKYTNKVVEETIRMANVAAVVFRTATRDFEYKGYMIPKGWKVLQWIRYVHTNSENFDDPMCFNPDRWNEPAKPGTYLVFGGGPRICAGNMLARIQLSLFLHHLSIGYKWELLNPDAKTVYLPHPKPEDGLELSFCRL